jgi:hypothetical protein
LAPEEAREPGDARRLGAVIGGSYGHFNAMRDGALLLGLAGVMRCVLTGAFMASAVDTVETLIATQVWAAPLHSASLVVHLAIQDGILLAVILSGLMLGDWLFPTPGEVGPWLPIQPGHVTVCLAASLRLQLSRRGQPDARAERAAQFRHRSLSSAAARERVSLFIDMVGSTGIAERLGKLSFLCLLNRFEKSA